MPVSVSLGMARVVMVHEYAMSKISQYMYPA